VPTEDLAAEEFRERFLSDRERGVRPGRLEERYPDLYDAISAFDTVQSARRRWEQIAERVGADRVRMGRWIARLRLEPGNGFAYHGPDPTGHVYVRGQQVKLIEAVVDVLPVRVPEG